jgi:hypothetical protein
MKILIKESQYKVLLEQGFEMMEPTTDAYNEIVDGAKYWMGTDKTKILKAFDYIKNVQDFKTLISMFKDKRTGYGSFEEMINKEYDRQDFKDIIKLRDKLYSIGVILNFNSGNSIAGNPLFLEGVKISYVNNTPKTPQPKTYTPNKYLQQVPKACSSKWQSQLEKSKNYWIQWLSNPITKTKFLNNWKKVEKNMTLVEVGNIFKKYIDSLKVLKLYYFDSKLIPDNADAFAFVNRYEPEKIFVNCSQNDPDPYGTLIHEMQHMLYNIKPLNPEVQIGNVFVDSNTKKSTIKTFFDIYKTKNLQSRELSNIDIISKNLGVAPSMLDYFLNVAKYKEKEDPGYVCEETEKMSNITAIRKTLGVKPGQNITKEMVLPYIKGEKDHTDVSWMLACWALKGFPDLNGMLNKINDLAYQNTNSNTRTV